MNYDYILSLNPIRVAFKGLIFYFFIFLITPAYVGIPLSPIPFVYIFLCYFSFILGTIPLRATNIGTKKIFSTLAQKRIFYAVLIFSLVGVTLRILERLVFRGVVIGGDLFDNRENLETSSTGFIGVFSTLLYPLVYFNLIWFYYCKNKNKLLFVIVIILFFFPSLDSYMIGSRSIVLQNIAVWIITLFAFGKIRFSFKNILIISGSIVLILLLFILILYNRLGGDNFDFDFTGIATMSDYNFTFPVKTSYIEAINNESNNFIKIIMFTFVHVGQYIVHGMFEFNYLVSNYNVENIHALGRSNLYLYYRIPDLIVTPQPQISLFPREGVYTTFFGDVYVDFGWYGLLFMLFFGFFSKAIYIKLLKGNVLVAPLYFILCYIIFFMMTANLITIGLGLVVIHSLLIPWFIYRIYMKIFTSSECKKNKFLSS